MPQLVWMNRQSGLLANTHTVAVDAVAMGQKYRPGSSPRTAIADSTLRFPFKVLAIVRCVWESGPDLAIRP